MRLNSVSTSCGQASSSVCRVHFGVRRTLTSITVNTAHRHTVHDRQQQHAACVKLSHPLRHGRSAVQVAAGNGASAASITAATDTAAAEHIDAVSDSSNGQQTHSHAEQQREWEEEIEETLKLVSLLPPAGEQSDELPLVPE